jgi:hypothetical protein|tara:strand:+ start:8724 stop:8960 length:237 start_codon:yes stop_codon:yes gene_type:complete
MKDKKMWGKDEVSTRNCYNAIIENGGSIDGTFQGIVSCRVGKEILDTDNNKLNDKRVASRGILFASCKNCSNFDNDWD